MRCPSIVRVYLPLAGRSDASHSKDELRQRVAAARHGWRTSVHMCTWPSLPVYVACTLSMWSMPAI